jgi:hypothetical protein
METLTEDSGHSGKRFAPAALHYPIGIGKRLLAIQDRVTPIPRPEAVR